MGVRFDDLYSDIDRMVADRKIKYPRIFKSAMRELKDMIGNNKIKDSIADQIKYIIGTKRSSNKPVMLNTMLYGPPGVGKTKIGKILSKLWYSLGFLNSGPRKPPNDNNMFGGMTSDVNGAMTLFYYFMIFFIILQIIAFMFPALYNCYGYMCNRIGTGYTLMILSLLILLIAVLILYYYKQSQRTQSSDQTSMSTDQSPVASSEKDSEYMVVVSGEDFTDKYVGWTDKKTIELLDRHRGKVVFIDECYSINSSPYSYGMEALTAINRRLSEDPQGTCIIMAGYRNLIKKHILDAQPGLESRFMWKFDCPGYTINELYEIFLLNLGDRQLDSKDQKAIQDLFSHSKSSFSAMARDVERLIFFIDLELCGDNIITLEHFKAALDRLNENSNMTGSSGDRDDDQLDISEVLSNYLSERRPGRLPQ